jgi:hypothetical protein
MVQSQRNLNFAEEWLPSKAENLWNTFIAASLSDFDSVVIADVFHVVMKAASHLLGQVKHV